MLTLDNYSTESFWLHSDQVFTTLNSTEADYILKSSNVLSVKKGTYLFREGGKPKGIYIVRSGKIKKYKLIPNGGQKIFYLCGQGEVFGYHSLIADISYVDSAMAIEDSEVLFIPKPVFNKVFQGSESFSRMLIRSLASEYSFFVSNLAIMAGKTVKERLAYNLLVLEKKIKHSAPLQKTVDINISRSDLASLVGTAIETLVRLLNDFKQEGLIDKDRKAIRILNRKEMLRATKLY